MKVETYWGHTFLPDLMQQDGVVFDFGVYDGGFSKLVASRCKRVIGFEPDPAWRERLPLPANVEVVHKALATRRGLIRLHLNREKCSSIHYSDADAGAAEVEAITLADALALEPAARIELIKMDIEGEEVPVLRDAAPGLFERVAQLTVEFHDFLDPVSLPAIRAVIDRMERLGFLAIKFSWHSYGDMLFVNRRLMPLSIWDQASLRVMQKYGKGIGRVVRRALQA
jgi:FkbM family methyltransferase